MNTSKYIKAIVGEGNYSVTSPITQWDYGYILQIEGIELPTTYEVDFSNDRYDGEALTAYGNAEGVEVPEELIETGRDVYAFYYYIGANHGKTTYTWKIPNELRAKRGEKHPTPSQQDVIDQAIVRINEAVSDTERDASAAAQSADKAEAAVEHYPQIENGTWRIWGVENETWIDTGLEAEGVDGRDGIDGVDGTDGVDGFSPVVTVTNSPTLGSHTISVRDKFGTKSATIYDGLSVAMLNSSFVIPTDANGVLTENVHLRASFKIRKANAVINGSISTAGSVQMDDPNDPSNVRVLNWSNCASIANPYSEIALPAGYKMHGGDSGTFSITLTADSKDFTFTPAWSIAKQGAKGDKGDPGEPALGMDIHICTSSEYDATTRVPMINGPDEHTFYLVPSAEAASPDLFVEWIYMNNTWEKFGSAAIALKRIKDDPSENGGVIEGDFYSVRATGLFSHAEGISTNASGLEAHAEGAGTTASGNYSHSEGGGTRATSAQSHAEGGATLASGTSSHAEGGGTIASGTNAHAEGNGTQANGNQSHAEGFGTTANGTNSHAEGESTVAQGNASHASGTNTIAQRKSQFVIGEFNARDGDATSSESTRGDYIFIAGNGSNTQQRSNAMTLDWNGNEKLSGGLTLGMGTNDETSLSASELKALKASGTSRSNVDTILSDGTLTFRTRLG